MPITFQKSQHFDVPFEPQQIADILKVKEEYVYYISNYYAV
jgi:hypothetical protein